MKRLLLAFVALFIAAAPAAAQFADQATYAGTGAGTVNAQTITLPNASSYADLQGVLIKYVPGATGGTINSGATTLNVNSFGTVAIRKPSLSGLVALTGNELVNGQPSWLMYDGTFFDLLSVTSTTVGAANLANSAVPFTTPVNLKILATVAANALTIAIKGNNGSDPSATNPVIVPFRDSTIANGDPVFVTLTAPLSFTIASGSSLGTVGGQMARLHLYVENNAGTMVLCAYNALSSGTVIGLNEGNLAGSASGTSGGNSAQTMYCNVGSLGNLAVRYIGYIEIQEGTAGTWATGPTFTQLFGPGVRKPGDTVQVIGPQVNSSSTSCGTSAFVTTSVTLNIQPQSAADLIVARAGVSTATASNSDILTQINRVVSGTPTAFGRQGYSGVGAASVISDHSLLGYDLPNTTSAIAYTVYCKGVTSPGTVNSAPGTSDIEAWEIWSKLERPIPANDNARLSAVG